MSTLFVLSTQSFATTPDIPATTTTVSCSDSAINTNNAPANLEINWEPNTINLHWYNGNTLVTSNTCVYDGGLTIPNPPSRTGYTFTGWRVRPQTNFAALKITTNGIKRWGIGKDEAGNFNICWYGSGTEDAVSVNCSKYYYEEYNKELQRYEWKVAFDWGNIYGVAHCSAKSGNIGSPAWSNDSSNWKATYSELESVSGDKKYCWCQATGYNPSDDDTIYGPSSVLAWIFRYDYGSGASCLSRCANYCSYTLATSQPFRLRLFREVQ